MKPDKDYTGAVNSLASRIVDVSKRKIGSKQISFTDGMFICAEVSQASQNIMASPHRVSPTFTPAPVRTSPLGWL